MKSLQFLHQWAIVSCLVIAGLGAAGSVGASEPKVRKPLPDSDVIADLPADGGSEFNRLVFEKSPYLLQHARNPVDWYPWGSEAFEKARKENKPVFLSIGYSTCHWCHVMEHESFEDEEVAALLNENFVPVKVDREERPDIDNVYMNVCRALTGRGGWPLTVVMTPDKTPFFAGTYFPKTSRFGREGMMDLVPRLREAWDENRDQLRQQGEQILSRLASRSKTRPGSELDESVLERGFQQLERSFDAEHGGFGNAPKFPTPHRLLFLLRYWHRTGNEQALTMVKDTLRSLRRGGVFDHVGFGFHRYSTDQRWLVPHFEKMLYDQALLLMAYVETSQATGDQYFADSAREIITYVLRDMTAPTGGFYSAEDADSEGVEGKFYLWTAGQIDKVLGDQASLYKAVYNIEAEGNFQNPHTPPNTNIPHLTASWASLAQSHDLSVSQLRSQVESARKKLFAAREKRIHPYKDDKVLTDWNGLMIAALAKAARVLDEPRYAKAAQQAADFLWDNVRNEEGRLLKRFRDGEAALPAHLEDYAFMVWGVLDLYESNFEIRNLQRAVELNEQMLEHFWDEEGGGLYFTADDVQGLPVRSKEIYDGAIPSGNSAAILNLLRLARITGRVEWEEKASLIARAFSTRVQRGPSAHALLLCALDFGFGPSHEVVIAGESGGADTSEMLDALRGIFAPNKVVLFRPSGEGDAPITGIAPFTEKQTVLGGKATAYVCQNHRCELPTNDPEKMLASLKGEDADGEADQPVSD